MIALRDNFFVFALTATKIARLYYKKNFTIVQIFCRDIYPQKKNNMHLQRKESISGHQPILILMDSHASVWHLDLGFRIGGKVSKENDAMIIHNFFWI